MTQRAGCLLERSCSDIRFVNAGSQSRQGEKRIMRRSRGMARARQRFGDVIGQFSQLFSSPKCLQARRGLCTVAEVLLILKGVACVWTLTVALSLYARARKK